MCGIAGIFGLCHVEHEDFSKIELLKQMLNRIAHRGPDDEGRVVLDNGNMYMGHRRLAIIDLSDCAKQPMQSADKRYTITYNGEIYNFRELKDELISRGHVFFSNSDTEVVLNAYAEWGINCISKFNGIFAFVIYDNVKKEILMVRDRYGVKPLYYAQIGDELVFASEYKAILLHPNFKKKINLRSVKQYFTFQNILDESTFFEGIQLLKAGCYMIVKKGMNQLPSPTQYWDYCFEEDNKNISKAEYEEELNFLFNQAIRRQLVSDVDVGAYLSGGIDSGSITAIATRYMPYMKSFTCGFDLHSASGIELTYDEREKAEYMSYCYKTEHYEMVLKAGDMERCMDKLVWHLEDPRVGQSYPNFYVSKLASQFVKVVLAGTGGDELFAGYPWRYYRAIGCNSFSEYLDSYYKYWQRLLNDEEMHSVFSPIDSQMKDFDMSECFRNVFDGRDIGNISPESSINHSLYFEAKTFLQGLLLVEDKLSMAFGLETRVPFLDNDLVDFAMKVPVKYKLSNMENVVSINENEIGVKKEKYYQKTRDGKVILRDVMNSYIPKDITSGVKQGFSAPDASWFKGESIEFVNSVVNNSNSGIYQFMDQSAVREIISKHMEGVENKRLFIWSILNFENWLKAFYC